MPYKDPERKRQWEREHRAERNARRRVLRKPVEKALQNISKATATRTTAEKPNATLQFIAGVTLGLGLFVLGLVSVTTSPEIRWPVPPT
jgi:hypothetical protein